jgi:hypothetical protein
MTEDTARFIARHDPGVSRDRLLEVARRRVAGFDAWRESLREGPGNLVIWQGRRASSRDCSTW